MTWTERIKGFLWSQPLADDPLAVALKEMGLTPVDQTVIGYQDHRYVYALDGDRLVQVVQTSTGRVGVFQSVQPSPAPAPIPVPVPTPTPGPLDPSQPQPLQNSDGEDIAAIFDPAWQHAGIPRVLLLAGVLAESGLNPKAERWGSRTLAAQAAIANGDMAALQAVIDAAGLDCSFGYSQRIVAYHWAGDRTMTARNCLAVRAEVFANPGRDLEEMAAMLADCLSRARGADLSPVGGDELLMGLVIYNSGHVPAPGDRWWSDWAENVRAYASMLARIRAG